MTSSGAERSVAQSSQLSLRPNFNGESVAIETINLLHYFLHHDCGFLVSTSIATYHSCFYTIKLMEI